MLYNMGMKTNQDRRRQDVGASTAVGEIRDNGGRTMDRYTVEILVGVSDGDYEDRYFLYVGESGNVPNGVFMSGDMPSDDPEISWDDLPGRVRRDIERELATDWSVV